MDTIAAGVFTYDDLLDAVDLRYYKLRAKNGAYFSNFTDEDSIAMLGAERVVNGDFVNWTGNTPDNWTPSAVDGTHYLQNVGDKCEIVNPSNVNMRMLQTINVPGETYRVRATISGWSLGGGYIGLIGAGQAAFTFSVDGDYEGYVTASDARLMVYFQNSNTGLAIDDVSCKKVLFP